ncbi:MAG: VOC family protein [Lachnospiraceae bacterium]|jgi:methylmalonyl-CoA/ethylmalonyl-CoA epimerase|nr:VOC family protein [Lachnospiraceae bacterium]
MKLHHLGYAVRDIEKSKVVFEKLGYIACGDVTADISRNVNILFMTGPDSTPVDTNTNSNFNAVIAADAKCSGLIELIATLDYSQPSPVKGLLKKQACVLYHPCYECEDIEKTLSVLTQTGFYLLHDIAPAPAIAADAVVAFLYNPDVGIIEILQLTH